MLRMYSYDYTLHVVRLDVPERQRDFTRPDNATASRQRVIRLHRQAFYQMALST